MSYWLKLPLSPFHEKEGSGLLRRIPNPEDLSSQPPHILQNRVNNSWASLRVARFHSRPAHADQLHLDLWWRGLNLAQDAGTFLYNAHPPWDNSLTSSLVHNTIVIDDQEFMLRAGRFLYLDWAEAEIVASETASDGSLKNLTAQHNGYRKLDLLHRRKVIIGEDGRWEVIDRLDGSPGSVHTARLHWLLPDWEYKIDDTDITRFGIRIQSPFGWVSLVSRLSSSPEIAQSTRKLEIKLARAGELLYGSGHVSPIMGWLSPTYGEKIPALSCIIEVSQSLPIELRSEWILPDET
jgi:hypothetical protein